MLRLDLTRKRALKADSSDSEDDSPKKISAVPSSFKIRKEKEQSGVFVIDKRPFEESEKDIIIEEDHKKEDEEIIDKNLQKILSKAKCGPAFEKNPGQSAETLGKRALKRARKAEQEKTKGKDWFDLPATELTDEARMDLELLQMRAAIDPKAHYRRNDRAVLPKYFQVGRVVDAPEDYYSSRLTKKERKKTMVDELLNDMEFVERSKSRYKDIQAAEAKKKRGAFQHRGGPPRRKKEKSSKVDKKRR